MSPFHILLQLVEAASLFVLGIVGLSVVGARLDDHRVARQVVVGLCLGLSALLSMADPLMWRPGIAFDARAVGIILAGPVGGPLSVLIVAGLCGAMRIYLGGAGMQVGLVGIAVLAAISLVWAIHVRRRGRSLDFDTLHRVAGTYVLGVMSFLFLLPSEAAGGGRILEVVGLLVLVNVAGIEIAGALIVWERQRRDALRALAAGEARLAAMADNVPGAIFQGRLTAGGLFSFHFVSEGVHSLLGHAPERLMADPGPITRNPGADHLAALREVIADAARALKPFSFDAPFTRPDGTRVSVAVHSTPRREPNGDTAWEGILLDVSVRVWLEGEARAARGVADAANAAKSRFLAYVVHELRSPLGAILGYCDLAAMNPLLARPADKRPPQPGALVLDSYLATIRSAAEHLAGMTEDLLDLGKTEAGLLDLHTASVDLAEIAARTVALLRHQADERDMEVVTAVAPGHRLEADPRRLLQILLNLVSNALKYSHPGGRVLVTSAREGEWDIVTVEDHGIGMSSAQLEIAVQAYGQVDNRLNRVVAGTGLGLPLVKRLVELHGGTLDLDSAVGRGTRAVVRLRQLSYKAAGESSARAA